MPSFTDAELKEIIARRDRRFDGRLYFGVKTTRIYCRPVCPARPKPENIVLFRSASEAEKHGYRPCLRCRPDLAPGSKRLDGPLGTVARALRVIQASSADELDVAALAEALGVTDRHLRRLFDDHLGASPIEIMITQRLHFAKQILLETATPVTDVAFAAGFGSVRRFNEAFKARFHQPPSALRRDGGGATPDATLLRIPVRAPYDFAAVLAYLSRHEAYGVERVGASSYRRFVPTTRGFGSVVVGLGAKSGTLTAGFEGLPLTEVRGLLARLRGLFDTDHDPLDLPVTQGLDPRGIRVPGCFEPFETAVSIILSQLVSTISAKATLRRLIERFGRPLGAFANEPVYAFPGPAVLAVAPVEEIGLTRTKGQAIRDLAGLVRRGELAFDAHEGFDETAARLLAIRGVGPWTAAMIAMRCLGNPDAFPASDLIVRRALERQLVDPADWATSKAYLTHVLWRDYGDQLTTKGAKT